MNRRALLCGINNYKSVRDLRGCLRDVDNLHSLLVDSFGFRPEDIRVLRDQDVIKKNLRREWTWLLQGASKGDTLVFHFSGHGSYVPDREGDEVDGVDEILCLYDMDFSRAGTYLLDDEIAKWTDELPEGADLVFLTDCCHSGSASRVMLTEVHGKVVPFALDQLTSFRLAQDLATTPEQTEVIARFLPPPEYVPSKDPAIHKGFRNAERQLNHLHLAACQDPETAADAPLNGQYHGAFTYHLCQLLRSEPRLASNELMSRLSATLAAAHFQQHPRENGGPRPGPIFGGKATAVPPVLAPHLIGAPPPRSDHVGDDVARHLIDAFRELVAAVQPGLARGLAARGTGRRVLVYVHGIDEHPGDYSLAWWTALQPHVGNLFGDGVLGTTRQHVHWSDIVNARAIDRSQPEEAAMLRRMIEKEMEERSAVYAEHHETRDVRGGGPAIDDFLRYMLQPSVRRDVLARFIAVVRPLLSSGDQLDIISHSWGTVVAYEGLLQLENQGLAGRVSNFFTVGSALSLGAVRWQLSLGRKKPGQVEKWINLDAKGDSIGGALSRPFDVDAEELELDPTGCERTWFGYSLSCAHSSYFKADNLKVNRDIFARHVCRG